MLGTFIDIESFWQHLE